MADPALAALNRPEVIPLAVPASQDVFGAPPPVPLTSFVGREREITAITALVRRDGVRLVTLTGPGGVGKTRLALRVVSDLDGTFTDGAAFVDLAPITAPDMVAPAIAAALGVWETGGQDVAGRLLDALRDRHLLLVLDNFEQVVEAAPAVTRLIAGCPRVLVLATSRVALRLTGERVILVEPLAVPDHIGSGSGSERVTTEAISLFGDRAEMARPGFLVSAENVADIADICRRVDGLPLAIELAAARIAHLSVSALLARLEKRLPVLTGGPRDVHRRQWTFRETIAWSHDLLAPDEQVLFRRLAVFVGGTTLDAVAAVASAPGDLTIDVFDGVSSLVANSLLRQVEDANGEPRYVLLETIREYGLERLVESGEEEAIRRAHADHVLAFAESESNGPGFPGTPARVAALEREDGNLRAALEWAVERGETTTGLRLVAALVGFWRVRGRLREGRAWSERVLALAGDTESTLRVTVEVMLGWNALTQGDYVAARVAAERSLAIARTLGDIRRTAHALNLLGVLEAAKGDFERQRALCAEAEALSRQAGDSFSLAVIINHLGSCALLTGDRDQAAARWEESLALWREIGDMWGLANTLGAHAWLAREEGNASRAAQLERQVLTAYWDLRAERELVFSLLGAAYLALAADQDARAARLGGASARLLERTGSELEEMDLDPYADYLARTRAKLGEEAFAAEWAAGEALTLAEAVFAAAITRDVSPAVAAGLPTFGLTPRELEVVRLVAAGRSNREIADDLFISVPTVKRHLTTVFDKLALPSRSVLNTYAHAHGLT